MSARKRYVEVSLESAEVPREQPLPERGEKIDQRTGAVVASLPGDTKPCPGPVNDRGKHHPDCDCAGSAVLVIRKPFFEAVDAADDSLQALEEAIAARDEVDPSTRISAPPFTR